MGAVRPAILVPLVLLAVACTAEPGSDEHDVEHARLAAGLPAEPPEGQTVTASALAARMQAGETPLLLDVRSEAEFAVSHLEGARRAETLEAAQALLAGEPREREVILYCSVGVRSGRLAEDLRRAGWTNVRDLEGSIFAWANAGHPVWRDGRQVREVHPYDEHWGRLLERSLWSGLE
jgi:rhodanese-related sulfurtransferase